MSYLSNELQRQMEHKGVTGLQIAQRASISPSQIYKWTNSDQNSISAEQLDAIAHALNCDENEHAQLLAAHLYDERGGKAAGLVRIEINGPDEMHDQPKPKTKGEKAIQYLIQERINNRDVNELIIELARCLGASGL